MSNRRAPSGPLRSRRRVCGAIRTKVSASRSSAIVGALELVEVELALLHDELVAPAAAAQAFMSEHLAEPVHRDLERVRGRRRWLLAPECVDQALRRNTSLR
jgi:hypothetical protein